MKDGETVDWNDVCMYGNEKEKNGMRVQYITYISLPSHKKIELSFKYTSFLLSWPVPH